MGHYSSTLQLVVVYTDKKTTHKEYQNKVEQLLYSQPQLYHSFQAKEVHIVLTNS